MSARRTDAITPVMVPPTEPATELPPFLIGANGYDE